MFSKGWLKKEITSWFKGVCSYITWSFIPTLCSFIWSLFVFVVFPNYWGLLALVGIIIILLFTIYFAFKFN